MIENGDVTENGNIENAKVTYFIFSFHYLLLELYRFLKNFQRLNFYLLRLQSIKKKAKKKIHSKLETSKKEKKKNKKRTKKERKINDRDRAKRFGNAKDRACSCMEFY